MIRFQLCALTLSIVCDAIWGFEWSVRKDFRNFEKEFSMETEKLERINFPIATEVDGIVAMAHAQTCFDNNCPHYTLIRICFLQSECPNCVKKHLCTKSTLNEYHFNKYSFKLQKISAKQYNILSGANYFPTNWIEFDNLLLGNIDSYAALVTSGYDLEKHGFQKRNNLWTKCVSDSCSQWYKFANQKVPILITGKIGKVLAKKTLLFSDLNQKHYLTHLNTGDKLVLMNGDYGDMISVTTMQGVTGFVLKKKIKKILNKQMFEAFPLSSRK